jgi:hypothetical protein
MRDRLRDLLLMVCTQYFVLLFCARKERPGLRDPPARLHYYYADDPSQQHSGYCSYKDAMQVFRSPRTTVWISPNEPSLSSPVPFYTAAPSLAYYSHAMISIKLIVLSLAVFSSVRFA